MPQYVFFKGQYMPLPEARIGVLTHALHYGTACFEGIRANWNAEDQQIYIFRGPEHYQRLINSCRILKIDLPYSVEQLMQISVEAIRRSGYKDDVYLRPLAYKSSEVLGVRLHNLEHDYLCVVTDFGPYLDLDKGIRCCTSSWRRVDDTMIPTRAKITGTYVNSALAKTEAIDRGFDEAIMLKNDGYVSEGSGENIFLVVDGKLVTPGSYDNVLLGITRDTVIKVAKEELGIETEERHVTRGELYLADECFMTGTAAHVTPVLEVDHRKIGTGNIGKLTDKLKTLYFDIERGKNRKYMNWCTPVFARVKA